MKELSIEEKAKRYDESIERAKEWYSDTQIGIGFKANLEKLFPELSESKDEKIRKEIINYFKCQSRDEPSRKDTHNRWIAWLEKQGKQDARYKYLEELLEADTIYQMAINFAMVEEAKSKAVNALSKLEISKLLGPEKQDEQSIKWNKNTEGNKPQKNHSVLIKTTHGIAEGEWNGGDDWIQYRWSCRMRDSDVLFWIELSDIEKQGEQKPADKVEPKFHEGDWIIDDSIKNPFLITDTSNGKYDVISTYGNDFVFSFNEIEHFYHLWTIQDAKDSDVLATDDGVCIFNGILEEGKYPFAYCGITKIRGFESYNGDLPFSHDNNIHPATKEQRDTLIKAMTDAGYTFNFEKKELKKIEPKPAWSEEDMAIIDDAIFFIQEFQKSDRCKNESDMQNSVTCERFLIFIKDKVAPQSKQEWSEEDEKYSSYICAALDCYYRLREERNNTNGQEDLDKARNWLYNKLKSLRPQSHWRPSDEQMMALYEETQKSNRIKDDRIVSLYNDLKKLMKE